MSFKEFIDKNRPTILYCLSIIFSIVVLSSQFLNYNISTFRSFFIYIFSFTYKPIYDIINYPIIVADKFIRISYLYEENMHLKKALRHFYVYKLYSDNISEKYKYLENFKDIKLSATYRLYLSEVISREHNNWFNECIIKILDKTAIIKEDMPVIVYITPDKFFLVGRIWQITGNIAKILLITNSLSMIPAKVKDKEVYGIVIGNGINEKLSMEYILLEDNIRIGDLIITSGINNIPYGIEIGKVVDVQISETGFKKAIVKLDYNINALKELLIISQ